jgi:hypothetical protein
VPACGSRTGNPVNRTNHAAPARRPRR